MSNVGNPTIPAILNEVKAGLMTQWKKVLIVGLVGAVVLVTRRSRSARRSCD
jgi:hypothetical protein